MAELEAQLAAATAEAEKQRDEWLRAKAETDNVRRRGQEDVAKAHRFGLEGFACALLAVKDSLDAALAVENASVESFKEGVEITARQLDAAFEKFQRQGNQPGRARSSIRTATRPSARSRATRSPAPWSRCCRRASCCTTASCARRWSIVAKRESASLNAALESPPHFPTQATTTPS